MKSSREKRFISHLSRLSAALLATIILIPVSYAEEKPAARIVTLSGKVLIRNEKRGEKMHPARIGQHLAEGDVINTDSNSSAKLLMGDRTILDIGPTTLFKLDEYKPRAGGDRSVSLSMDYGKVRSSVNTPIQGKGKFQIRTKSATMGVRGTEFIVAADMPETPTAPAAPTEITVVSGNVAVASTDTPTAAPIAVTAGQQMTTAVRPAMGDVATGGATTGGAPSPGGGGATTGGATGTGGAPSPGGGGATTGGATGTGGAPSPGGGGATGPATGAAEGPQVVTLAPAQMASVTSAARVEDQTFTQAVTIGDSGGGQGEGGGPGSPGGGPGRPGGPSIGGAAALEAISNAVSNAVATLPPPPPNFVVPPGGFQNGAPPPPPPVQQGMPVRVNVDFRI